MKTGRRIIYTIISVYIIFALFPIPVNAEKSIINAAQLDSSVYCNIRVEKVEADFQVDNKGAEKAYKKLNIALFGAIKEVEQDGKELRLKTSSEAITITCKVEDKTLREQVRGLVSGEHIIAIGTVSKATAKSFVVKTKLIKTADSKIESAFDGKTDSSGRVYSQASLREIQKNAIDYFVLAAWPEIEAKRFKKYQLGPSEYEMHFDLKDGEYLDLYFLDWEKLLTAAKSATDRREDKHSYIPSFSDEERCQDYLTGEWLPGVKVLAKNQGTKKTDSGNYKYYICSRKDSGGVCAELFFMKTGDMYIAVSYFHGDYPSHSQEVAFFLGGITPQRQKK